MVIDSYPSGSNEDALAKRLMSEFRDWCERQGLAAALEKAEDEAALLETAEQLEDAFAELAAEGKARSICVPKADGTIERRWSFTSKGKSFTGTAARNSGPQLEGPHDDQTLRRFSTGRRRPDSAKHKRLFHHGSIHFPGFLMNSLSEYRDWRRAVAFLVTVAVSFGLAL
jgi:hypothetical protein